LTFFQEERDSKRMSMYLENHNSLKQLVNEEKSFPFRKSPSSAPAAE
jgi:hypothetical protein